VDGGRADGSGGIRFAVTVEIKVVVFLIIALGIALAASCLLIRQYY